MLDSAIIEFRDTSAESVCLHLETSLSHFVLLGIVRARIGSSARRSPGSRASTTAYIERRNSRLRPISDPNVALSIINETKLSPASEEP